MCTILIYKELGAVTTEWTTGPTHPSQQLTMMGEGGSGGDWGLLSGGGSRLLRLAAGSIAEPSPVAASFVEQSRGGGVSQSSCQAGGASQSSQGVGGALWSSSGAGGAVFQSR